MLNSSMSLHLTLRRHPSRLHELVHRIQETGDEDSEVEEPIDFFEHCIACGLCNILGTPVALSGDQSYHGSSGFVGGQPNLHSQMARGNIPSPMTSARGQMHNEADDFRHPALHSTGSRRPMTHEADDCRQPPSRSQGFRGRTNHEMESPRQPPSRSQGCRGPSPSPRSHKSDDYGIISREPSEHRQMTQTSFYRRPVQQQDEEVYEHDARATPRRHYASPGQGPPRRGGFRANPPEPAVSPRPHPPVRARLPAQQDSSRELFRG